MVPAPAAARIVSDALASQVCILRAAAGWGKTSAARSALEGREHVWIELEALGEPAQIPRRLAGALGLRAGQAADDILAALPPGTIVAIDDLHKLGDDPQSLEFLKTIVALRRDVRLVLCTRDDPPLPVATWIAAGIAALPVTQADLALDDAAVEAMLAGAGSPCDPQTVARVLSATQGWAVAVRFAVLALARTDDFARVERISTDLAFRYSVERIVGDLPAEERALLSDLALAGTISERVIAALGYDAAAERLAWLARAGIPLHYGEESTRLHEAVAAFVIERLPHDERVLRARHVAAVLAELGAVAEAVEIVRRHAFDSLEEFVEAHGRALFASGRRALVREVVASLPSAARREQPTVLMLRAALEYGSGNFSLAKELSDQALERVDKSSALFGDLMRWRAMLNLYESRETAGVWIDRMMKSASPEMRRELRGPNALFLAMNGQVERGIAGMNELVAEAEREDDELALRRAYSWATTLHAHAGNLDLVNEYGAKALALHERANDLRGTTIVANTLAVAALVLGDDRDELLRLAHAYARAAERWGETANVKIARGLLYQLAVERGDGAAAATLEQQLGDDAASPFAHAYRFARAMRLGWNGEFSAAARLFERIGPQIADLEEKRSWHAELAFLLALAGDDEEAIAHLAHVTADPVRENAVAQRERRLADVYAGFAEIFVRRPAAARKRFPHAVRQDERALVEAGVALSQLGDRATSETIAPILLALAAAGKGGIARLLQAAVAAFARPASAVGLTEAEVRTLRLVALGRSPRTIAQESERSVETVRNHIKAAIRKLGVSGRLEAIAAARDLGLI